MHFYCLNTPCYIISPPFPIQLLKCAGAHFEISLHRFITIQCFNLPVSLFPSSAMPFVSGTGVGTVTSSGSYEPRSVFEAADSGAQHGPAAALALSSG